MTSKKDIFLLYFLLIIEILILLNSKIVINSVIKSSKLFIFKIFPSLMPTMIIGLLLAKLNFHKIIPKFIKKTFGYLFNFDDVTTSIFITSMLCGSPSSASFINEYLNNGKINEKTAENLLCCTHFINPLFVISAVGIDIFNSTKIGMIILFLTHLSNFIKAFLLRKNFVSTKLKIENKKEKEKFMIVFKDVIKVCMMQLLVIFGIVILFNMLTILIKEVFNINYFFETIINIILEITGGINKISYLNISFIFKIFLSYYSLSFGGICIQMQTLSMITNKKIKYLKYFIFRLF